MAYIKEEDYKHPLPFDNTVGKDAFRFVPTAPPVADVDEEFKTQFAYKRKITLKDRGVMYPYTEEQKAELKKCKYDIFYFLENYAHIISLDEGIIKFQPYQYQKNMIKVMDENRFSIFMLPRQMGKCCSKNVQITIRNKNTGVVEDISFIEFYDRCKKSGQT